MAENGQWVGEAPPIGYELDRETHRLRVCPEEAKLVEKIIELSIEGDGTAKITHEINRFPSGHGESVPSRPSMVRCDQEGEEIAELLPSHSPSGMPRSLREVHRQVR